MIAISVPFCFLLVVGITSGFSMQFPGTQALKGLGKTPKAIIFDIDGTLADSWKLGYDATLVVLKNHGIPLIDEATYHKCTKFSTPQRLARHAGLEPIDPSDNKSDDAAVLAEIQEHNARYEAVGEKLAAEFDDLYVGLVTTETAGFFPGIQDVLQRITETTGSKIGCLTNACAAYAHAVLEANDKENGQVELRRICSSVHGADTVPAAKPEPDGLYVVCEELGVPPSEAVYVGDSPSDAFAAQASGMPSIGVTWGSHSEDSLRQAPFDFYASTPDELCQILNLL